MARRSLRKVIKDRLSTSTAHRRLARLNRQLLLKAKPDGAKPTVAFFVASTRLVGMSLNAAFNYLAACGLQVAGYPVVYFACHAGMSRCVLGTNKDDPAQRPPCKACIDQSGRIFKHAPVVWFDYAEDRAVKYALTDLGVANLINFEFPMKIAGDEVMLPLGELVLPSLRWALRRHNLLEDDSTRFLFGEYVLSAWRVANEFARFLDEVDPAAVVVFNGILFPEAVARWVARRRGLRVITHEVGFGPFSGFFTEKDATAYPLEIPPGLELTEDQHAQLDAYLERRFQGKFTMAGIQFWPDIQPLDQEFLRKAERFAQIVPVFTNVIYDTSQVHANNIFQDMFDWLDAVHELTKEHSETLFVIRAHPDEIRPGKQSRESVRDWVRTNHVESRPNVIFVNSDERLSSYELIERSKFVMVYNSSIGLEAALLGKVVLCGGRARYSSYGIVITPTSEEEFRRRAEELLSTRTPLRLQPVSRDNARKFMYYQIFKASLPFEEFLEQDTRPGFVRLKPFSWRQLKPETSATIRILVDGIVHGRPFLMDSN
jgi:hypothetical protein